MGSKGRDSAESSEEQRGGPKGSADELSDPSSAPVDFPKQSPLFYAQHSERYERQRLIREYQRCFHCRLVVLVDVIFPDSITLLEELIADADPSEDLHLLLDTPGGDGETAVRLARSAQARCAELTVIVPNQAKSAGTLLAMGAHHILMGPTSDLGPVDPQFPSPEGGPEDLYSAKDLIAAVDHAEASIAAQPDTFPLHVSLLAKVNAVMVQQARSALERSGDLVREALRSQPDRSEDDVEGVACAVQEKLIDLPKEHGAVFDAGDAEKAGLPVIHADPRSDQWRLIWLLWAKYFSLESYVAEGQYASQIAPRADQSQVRDSSEQ
ncbi:MAG: hypothetical protein WBL45_00510 [Solirubrobacterales bacterium]